MNGLMGEEKVYISLNFYVLSDIELYNHGCSRLKAFE